MRRSFASVAALVAALAVGVVTGCAGTFGTRPIYSFSVEAMGGNCTAYTAVDSRGLKQEEHGCEDRSGGVRARRVGPEALARIERAFAALPQLPVPIGETYHCPDPDALYMLAVQREGEERRSWSFCRGPDGFRAPFAEAVAALTGS
ncbi:MAG: hypothetical protein H6713_15400 [Myxococcales bacterium]|nr:hypothetical protein [Myxococcales bacterium]